MFLTPEYKQSMVEPIITNVFTHFYNAAQQNAFIDTLIAQISFRHQESFTALSYKGQLIAGSQAGMFKTVVHYITADSPDAVALDNHFKKVEQSKIMFAHIRNYVTNGLVNCHTTECIRRVFPRQILSIFADKTDRHHAIDWTELEPDSDKIKKFREKFKDIEHQIKFQLATNVLTARSR